ncbi:MAG TPA: fumarylacetoacetate hydrolase family protein [bacterium]|nr:fumarylacetoacetate hydrolase family protein [bacterium]HOL34718.1 fumarylacetoacetate hydrolase family protein [bacterium]HPP08029.1 fumarylacetoacetate hydrolase family protein [bacterium]
MKLGRFRKDQNVFTGIVEGDKVGSVGEIPIEKIIASNLTDNIKCLISSWFSLQELEYAPLINPGKIICLGLNYKSHAEEGGWHLPAEPVYFEKSSSCIIPNRAKIYIPDHIGRIDPEVELAVMIGKICKNVSKQEAIACIAGYTILNDVTARAMQKEDQAKKYPWFRSKSMDTFCPIGPWIVTTDEIDWQEPLKIELRINGEAKQSSSTDKMIFQIPDIICSIARYLTLYPGDIISTGTPEGISPVKDGDIVECEIEKIGILSNPVVSYGKHC